HLVQRSLVLFVVGAFMALVLNLLQIQRNVTLFPDEVISTLFSSAWWVPPCCGTAAARCGLEAPVSGAGAVARRRAWKHALPTQLTPCFSS
ncbi:PREDICTED: insulin-induced gene 1 protein-like, partial [Fulmarus glacialis]|uniref:insulin-induced gene 1 protein-like n=1 Tax=Fulmarus glacialis TaxID=30455 RepID=UPI00051C7E8B